MNQFGISFKVACVLPQRSISSYTTVIKFVPAQLQHTYKCILDKKEFQRVGTWDVLTDYN